MRHKIIMIKEGVAIHMTTNMQSEYTYVLPFEVSHHLFNIYVSVLLLHAIAKR